jgi:hypothetical protein
MSALLPSASEINDGGLYLVANNHSTRKLKINLLLLESRRKSLSTDTTKGIRTSSVTGPGIEGRVQQQMSYTITTSTTSSSSSTAYRVSFREGSGILEKWF